MIGLHDSEHNPSRHQLGLSVRTDIPSPEDQAEHVRAAVRAITRDRAPLVALLIVALAQDASSGGMTPYRELATEIRDECYRRGIGIYHALWTPNPRGGQRWQCYDDPACTGIAADPGSTELAARATLAGLVTYDSREALAASLAPHDAEALERRAPLFTAAANARPLDNVADTLAASAVLLTAVVETTQGHLPTADEDVVRLVAALVNPLARDEALYATATPEYAAGAEALWLHLTRATPAPQRAYPAGMLSVAAYLRGDGALAGIAADVALEAASDSRLAGLLRQALNAGIPPKVLHDLLNSSETSI
jgi:Domain of unknown function (DUF4192)